MNATDIDKLTQYLDKIGAKLGMGAEQLWPILIRQVYVDAAFCSIALVIFTIIGWRGIKWTAKKWPALNANDIEPVPVIIGGIYFVIYVSFLFWTIGTIEGVFNPQYAALVDLLHRIQ